MTGNTKAGKLDRRVRRTYQQLEDALVQLLMEKPFDQITVQELCDQAMIRRTTFYQHFRDKQDFVERYVKDKRWEFSAWIAAENPPEDFGEHFLFLCARVLDYMRSHEAIEKTVMKTGVRGVRMLESFLRGSVDEMVERLNAHETQKGEGGEAVPILAEFYVGGLLAALRWWYANDKPCTDEELLRYLRGIVERRRKP